MDRIPATVLASRELSPTVAHLRLGLEVPLGYVAGQWVDLHVPLPDGTIDKRAYSIANAPGPDGHASELDLVVTRVAGGRVSPPLHALEVGARLEVAGPSGFFVRDSAATDPLLLVGTGSGLAPLRAIAQEVLATTELPVTLLFGCRTRRDILFRDELQAWADAGPQFSLHVTLSRPDADWGGLRGYVQDHVLAIQGDARPQVFICGLSPMVRAVRAVLKQQPGYDRRRVHSERYD